MTTVPNDLHLAFHATEDSLRHVVLERPQETHTAQLALIGRQHHFTLGSPGIAKSLLVDQLVQRIEGARYFTILMTRYTQPEEVFGGPNVKRLAEEGVYERVTKGMLPEAEIVFSDEIFKANSAILNAKLKAIHERKFNLGPSVIDIPLHTMFCASNELPQSEELNALWDRLHFRHYAAPIQETTNFVKMLALDIDDDPQPTLTMDQIHAAWQVSSRVEIPDEVFEATIKLKEQLLNENVEVSDRRWREAMRVIRSEAFYNGNMVADINDMRPLMHVLWSDPDQIKLVRRLVLDLANPLEREASELLDQLTEAYSLYEQALKDAENKQQKAAHGVDMYKKLNKTKDSYKELRRRSSGKGSDVMDELGVKIQIVGKQLLKGLGHDEDDEI